MADGLFGGGGAAFGIYPQMGGRRTMQDPQASADIPADVFRGRFAGLLGAIPDFLNLKRSLLPAEAVQALESYGKIAPEVPYGSEYYLQNLPLAPTSPVGQLAGQVGSFVPLNPMPVVRGVQTVGRMMGERMAENVVTGRPNLPSMIAEPKASLFAVEPSPSMAAADDSSAMRQQLTGKMQALLAQKKVATSDVEVGAINQQIGELQAQFKSLPAMGRVAREVVAPQITAPASDLGFYSAAEQATMNLERSKGTGQSFLNDLMNAPDVKKDELSWIGLDDFLKDKPNVTKQEVQDFIANNKVDLQEVRLGGNLSPELQTTRDALNDKYKGLVDNIANAKSQFEEGKIPYSELRNTISNNQIQIQALDTQINEINKTIPSTKHQRWQLAGGENYREILLKLPDKKNQFPDFEQWITNRYGGEQVPENVRQAARKEYERQSAGLGISSGYQSSHFNEPNILAHIRVNDRIDADGKKMLLVEEIQSDWHQAGREKGYNTPQQKAAEQEKLNSILTERQNLLEEQKRLEELASPYTSQGKDAPREIVSRWSTVSNRLQNLQTEQNRLGRTFDTGVPDAPFKDTWYQLSLKRILKYAADNGYERVGLTTGKQQADRYKLSNEVDEINVIGRTNMATGEKSRQVALDLKSGGSYKLGVNNEGIIDNVNMLEINSLQGKKLADVVGKEVAKKIMESNSQTIKGEGLNIGGEGMKKYYDEIYPKFLEKYGKKWDAGVGETKVRTNEVPYIDYVVTRTPFSDFTVVGVKPDGSKTIINQNANSIEEAKKLATAYKDKYLKSGEPIRYIDITPKMKESVGKGQPLFTAIPAGTLGLGGLEYADPFANPLAEDTTR